MVFQQFDEQYKRIKEEISIAAEKSCRDEQAITLLAATKTVPVEMINHAVASGIKVIGENRVQEFLEKYDQLLLDQVTCHFIGRLQSNKVKYIVDKVSLIQSVDSIKLARVIAEAAKKINKTVDILVEVNIGKEESKGGILPEALEEFIDEVRQIDGVCVAGLMTIPPISDNIAELSNYFAKMHKYYVDITAKKLDNVCMHYLSMGMSDDYSLAIEQGANMVRVGSALFGRTAVT